MYLAYTLPHTLARHELYLTQRWQTAQEHIRSIARPPSIGGSLVRFLNRVFASPTAALS